MKIFSGIIITLVFLFVSCSRDPEGLGLDLLPDSDEIHVKVDSSTLIDMYTISGKRILTSANELYVLGSLEDSIFGKSTASIITQFHPVILKSADSLRTVDSLVLLLSVANHYGDTLSPLTLRIFELNKKLETDTSYFSDMDPSDYFDPADLLSESVFTPGDSLIRVKIEDPSFLSKFEDLPDSIFKDRLDFAEAFYGLYLTVDPPEGKGGFAYINLSSFDTRLYMYYNGDTLSYGYEMGFTTLAAKANIYTHDYNGYPVAANLDLPGASDSVIYIEGLAGTSGRISFPTLASWRSKGSITINKAELIFPVDTLVYPSLSPDEFPDDLLLFSLQEDGEYDYLYDYRIAEGGDYYGGSYNKDRNVYLFNIALHLQSYIDGKIDIPELVVVSRRSHSSANRVLLKGTSSSTAPVKLKVIYTELF